nr:hypothetical protein B0A51_15687 [Rachicladosporium sp. CCFEE 5018]
MSEEEPNTRAATPAPLACLIPLPQDPTIQILENVIVDMFNSYLQTDLPCTRLSPNTTSILHINQRFPRETYAKVVKAIQQRFERLPIEGLREDVWIRALTIDYRRDTGMKPVHDVMEEMFCLQDNRTNLERMLKSMGQSVKVPPDCRPPFEVRGEMIDKDAADCARRACRQHR